jgi:type I restriction enzyme R subunit
LELAELEGVSDIEELNQVLDRAVNLKNMLKNRDRMDKVARFVAEHFRNTIEPMGYKAFLVAVDREACVLYKRALDKYLPPEYSTVVISSGGKGDPDMLREVQLSDSQEKEVRKAFRNPERLPKIMIVTEKLLTGFDAPILYCMYLDKPMRDHVLLQAIARVNRPYEDADGRAKPAGFVLDLVGIFENLEKALAFDSQDVSGVVEGIDVLKGRFAELMDEARSEYLPITSGYTGDKAVEALLEHFRDKERRQEFYQFFRELESVYEILSPDPFLRPFIDDYSELARFYNVLRACYERGLPIDRDFLRKTAQLVQQHTDTGTIQTPTKVHRLDSDTLEQIAGSGKPATVKIFNLLKALHDIVERDARQEPYLISIGDKAEQIAQAFEARQETTQKTLEELERLLAELRQAQQRRAETELSPEAFAVFWMLQRDGVEKAQDVAQAAAMAFDEHPHWQSSSHQEQEVRKSLYKALITAGVDGVVEVAQRLMKMLRRAS